MNISFAKVSMPKSGALILTAGEKATLSPSAAKLDADHGGIVKRAIAASRFQGKRGQILELLSPADLGVSRLVILGIGPVEALTPPRVESLGGVLAGHLLGTADKAAAVLLDPLKAGAMSDGDVAAHLALGADLRDYRFDRYRTRRDKEPAPQPIKLTVMTDAATPARAAFKGGEAAVEGTKLARDLVSEPPNVLFPKAFAKRCQALTKLGVAVEVLGEKEMAKLGMHTLLGVGRGSRHESQLVVMTWNGKSGAKSGRGRRSTKAGAEPLAFVGKGVTFDTGGISLKPGAGMEDMKGDMGGAAAVVGLMHALASRKAKADVVGVVGLVENMPDGDAQRPGDIVTSMSGQTIEIINTDAEGRLVLADALWYTQDRFKPRFMIDLATLTGGIINTFGHEYAGLFTEDDRLAEQLYLAGITSGEKLWRQPMGDVYDKMIDSQFADMKNATGRAGGSITAAQFLRRFSNGVPFVHLDIASTAWTPKPSDTAPSWATGFGVRLLDRFVTDHFEK